ncbi:formylglycine-generating enzyme family protein [Micromonospora mirobrigensis]|uniref:Formylglycine-generating enzyme, required for sulfatase activity, contains SUMF1/FGE domain n=1 Tax=Micromonospora mirobrigensis TaxID=262898 RepID=A0A1C4ZBQ4_9ACTN|nr:SUMF1/EgtB/PvdO family nonheme iron enzyme [Micromonospora mirobrigensis]SCF30387.1 Formylglycine-generating enzyme, required for sulfatase activity, contains SUMF1/FGE domain [Micromonospora mirobrigensis]
MTRLQAVLAELQDGLIEVPAGTTTIGSTSETVRAELAAPDMHGVRPEWLLKEVPRHLARLPTFWISRVPLTVDQVAALAPSTGVRPTGDARHDHPATVQLSEIDDLYRALSELIGRVVTPPTEEQWVRAARGDDERVYPWGDDWQEGLANMAQASLGTTAPVGSFPAGRSAFGLLDMAGNADELTRTPYAPFPGAPAEVPAVEDWAHAPYVTKGGGYMHARDLARCDRRHGIYAADEPLALRLVVESAA